MVARTIIMIIVATDSFRKSKYYVLENFVILLSWHFGYNVPAFLCGDNVIKGFKHLSIIWMGA